MAPSCLDFLRFSVKDAQGLEFMPRRPGKCITSVVGRQRAAWPDHVGEEGCLSRGMEYLNKDTGRRKLV
jgi:hypothetical protein